MATENQIVEIFNELEQSRPTVLFKNMDEMLNGMGFILFNIEEAQREIFAIELSEKMGISRARIAVLIKKLISKGFVETEKSLEDARKDIIRITSFGRRELEKVRNKIYGDISKVIDEIGIDKLNEFIEISSRIREIIQD